jgi:hypothetical protein
LLLQLIDPLQVGFGLSDPFFGTDSDQQTQGYQHKKNGIDGPKDLVLSEDIIQKSGDP